MYCQLGEPTNGPGATCHGLFDIDGKNIVIDCGIGINNELGGENHYPDLFKDERIYGKIDLILLTHHHLDHCGALPLIAKMNPKAIIMMTDPARAGSYIMINDALKIHHQDQKKIRRQGGSLKPFLYNERDIGELYRRVHSILRPGWHAVWPGWEIGFHSSGHTRGATMIIINPPEKQAYLITGDISSHDQPMVKGVMLPAREFFGDRLKGKKIVLITETTYGNRELAKPMPEIRKEFRARLKEAVKNRLNALLPSFADRAPALLKELTDENIACHVDGMAIDFCELYAKSVWCEQDIRLALDELVQKKLAILYERFDKATDQKDRLAEDLHREHTALGGCCGIERSVIISSSAMVEKGRSVQHAERILPNRKGLVVFSGYMFPGTVGEQILKVEKGKTVKLNAWDRKQKREVARPVPVSCEVSHFSLSGHDPADKLVERIARLNEICPVEAVIGHHGDLENYAGFEKRANALNLGIPVIHGVQLKKLIH